MTEINGINLGIFENTNVKNTFGGLEGYKDIKLEAGEILEPNSVGSNVVICFEKKILVKVHFAVLIVPWSSVESFHHMAISNVRSDGMMYVDISKLSGHSGASLNESLFKDPENYTAVVNQIAKTQWKDSNSLFPEDFAKTFQEIFLKHFVGLIHDQFNQKKEESESGNFTKGKIKCQHLGENKNLCLPHEHVVLFKLLVLCERLNAKLKVVVFERLRSFVHNDFKSKLSSVSASKRYSRIKESYSYQIIRCFITTIRCEPCENTLQGKLLNDCIKSIVGTSSDLLSDLIYLSSAFGKPYFAQKIFHHVKNILNSSQSSVQNNINDIREEVAENMKRSISAKQERNFKDTIERMESANNNKMMNICSASLSHGVVFDKFRSGLVVLWCDNSSLNWMKVDIFKRKQHNFWIPSLETASRLEAGSKNGWKALEGKEDISLHSEYHSRGYETAPMSVPYKSGSLLPKALKNFIGLDNEFSKGSILKENVISIGKNENDPFGASFFIKFKNYLQANKGLRGAKAVEKLLIFRAKDAMSCSVYIEMIVHWLGRPHESQKLRNHSFEVSTEGRRSFGMFESPPPLLKPTKKQIPPHRPRENDDEKNCAYSPAGDLAVGSIDKAQKRQPGGPISRVGTLKESVSLTAIKKTLKRYQSSSNQSVEVFPLGLQSPNQDDDMLTLSEEGGDTVGSSHGKR